MNPEAIAATLRAHEAEIRGLGVRALYLFGSAARGEASPASDVDLFLDYEEGSGFSLVELARLQRMLASYLGSEVDLTTRGSLHPALRPAIEAAARRVL